MKKIKKISILILTFCLLAVSAFPVYAKGSREPKTLYFEQQNGKMVWNNVRGSDGNWFMSFTNMVPGGNYNDRLKIENGSRKTYDLYMQVLPVEQDQKREELLELISTKVVCGSNKLYEGTASGKDYHQGNLRNVIYIGRYEPKETDTISVDLELSKDIGIEYCDILTKVDWKFMVTEVPDQGNTDPDVKEIKAPKTGDETNMRVYIAILACAAGIAILVTWKTKSADHRKQM